MGAFVDITGQKFNRLLALEFIPRPTKSASSNWRCLCDCGGFAFVSSSKLKSGNTVSCGCKKGENKLISDRLLSQSIRDEKTGCLEWTGAVDRGGYGRAKISLGKRDATRTIAVHRASYEQFKGPIPEGLEVCHSCDNRKCIEPKHLWVGTHQENMHDMHIKGRGAKGYKRKQHVDTAIAQEAKGAK